MNEELVEKNMLYQDQIQQIAKQLYYSFFFDEEERMNHMPAVDLHEREEVGKLLAKAEKIYQYYESADEAKKMIKFLQIVSPVTARAIFERL